MQKSIVAAALILTATLMAAPAEAQSKRVRVVGCPFVGVPPTCLMLRGPNGTVYNINAARPAPRPDYLAIALTGTVTTDMSICFNTVLKDIRWSYTKMRCRK